MANDLLTSQKFLAELEALLFIHGEPLEIKKIARLLSSRGFSADEAVVNEALKELQENYQSENRGLVLIFSGDKAELATKPEFGELLGELVKEELSDDLTPASLETLAIITYGGPASRSIIDYVRGVNSSFILRALLLRGLIERLNDSDRAHGYVYQASFETLKHLGLSRVEELPEYNKFKETIEKLKPQASS